MTRTGKWSPEVTSQHREKREARKTKPTDDEAVASTGPTRKPTVAEAEAWAARQTTPVLRAHRTLGRSPLAQAAQRELDRRGKG